MPKRKIALIGNSGLGKSTIAARLGDTMQADMDRAPIIRPPSRSEALNWIVGNTQNVLAISVYVKMLRDLRDAKARGEDAHLFDRILFVFLFDSDPERRRRFLRMPNADGVMRADIEGSLKADQRVDDACRFLADVAINRVRLDMQQTVAIVAGLRDACAGMVPGDGDSLEAP